MKQRIPATRCPVTVTRIHRRMRGGSQSFLVQCEDGHHYVAKLLGNPQGRRTLMNELIVSQLITQFDIETPSVVLLHLSDDLLASGDLYFLMGEKRVRPEGNLHLGSRVPVNPETTAIFDFLPDRLLPKVKNLSDFGTMLILDKWFHHTDRRQAVFVRDTGSRGTHYLAHFIDHGMCFGGINWDLGDAPSHGLALQRKIYSGIDMADITRSSLSKVEHISEKTLLATAEAIPPEWFAPGDRSSLDSLFGELRKRQRTLPLLIERHLRHLGL